MKYEIKKLEKSAIKLTIELTPEEMERHTKKACEDISKDLKISGFRPGHAPVHIVEQNVGKKHIQAHATEIAVQYSYAEAIMKEKLQVISRPKIKFISDTTKEDEPLKFEAEVAVVPEIEIKDYKSIKIPKEEVKVTEKEVEDVIQDLQKHFTEWKDVDREVKKGDRAEIDFEGFEPEDKKAIPNTGSKNHPVIVGDEVMVPGFEDKLIGMKKDEKKEFEVTFPKPYHKKDFENKKVLFKVEVKRIEEGKKSEINEEFTQKVTGQKLKIDEFKKDVERNVKAQKEQKAQQTRETKLLEEILKRAKMDVPEVLLEEEMEHIIGDMKRDMEGRGMKFEDFLEQTKMKLEDLQAKYKDEAERRIKVRMAVTHIIEKEKIEVTDKELEAEFEKNLEMYPEEHREKLKVTMDSKEEKFKMKNQLLLGKFFEKMLQQ